MNFVVSWLLRYTQHLVDGEVQYNEVDAWYLLIHICSNLRWREVYKPGMNKLTEHLTLISEVINTGFPEVYNHLL